VHTSKIILWELILTNLIVVGAAEKESRTVNIRNRDDPESQKLGVMVPLDEARAKLTALRKERRLVNAL
jgi:threonyl-tRNA synthetase